MPCTRHLAAWTWIAVVVTFVSAVSSVSSHVDCQAGSSCVALSRCPDMKDVALRLASVSSKAKKGELLQAIRKQLCGEDVKSAKHLHVCCNDRHLEQQNQPQVANGASQAWRLTKETFHEVSGTVEFLSPDRLVIRNFAYDGEAPDAFFAAGLDTDAVDVSAAAAVPLPHPADADGRRRNYDDPTIPILGRYDGSSDLELRMPRGITVHQLRWLSLVCREYSLDFGHVYFPVNVPRN